MEYLGSAEFSNYETNCFHTGGTTSKALNEEFIFVDLTALGNIESSCCLSLLLMQAHSVAITLLSLSSWMCCWKCIRINLSGILIERGSWLAMSTTGTFLFFVAKHPSIKVYTCFQKGFWVYFFLADEESSVGARAPLSASVWSKSSKSHRSEWSCAPVK